MGMWQRLKRVGRSFVGFFVSSMEDPEMILEQNMRDLNDQIPKMNQSIAMVRANVTLLEKDLAKYKNEVADLTSKIKAAIQADRDDIAATYAIQLQQLKSHLHQTEGQLEAAQAAYEKSLDVKKGFIREKDRKIREAQQALQDHRRAQWQSKVADTLESFEVVGLDATHDEMIRKIEEKTAMNEARMEMALDSIDHQGMQIEEDAEKIRAQELVKQFKLQMGSEQAPALSGQAAVDSVEEEPTKTIGKKVEVE